MATAMIGVLTALAFAAPQQAPIVRAESPDYWRSDIPYEHRERAVYEDVLILARGDNSGLPQCGVLRSSVAIKGRLPSGDITYFYQTWCEAGQAMPPISGQCRFEIVILPGPDGFVSGENDRPADDAPTTERLAFREKVIERFDCTISSDSPTTPPGRDPVPPVST